MKKLLIDIEKQTHGKQKMKKKAKKTVNRKEEN